MEARGGGKLANWYRALATALDRKPGGLRHCAAHLSPASRGRTRVAGSQNACPVVGAMPRRHDLPIMGARLDADSIQVAFAALLQRIYSHSALSMPSDPPRELLGAGGDDKGHLFGAYQRLLTRPALLGTSGQRIPGSGNVLADARRGVAGAQQSGRAGQHEKAEKNCC